ncbi:hypothetical protein BV25DRAFT_1843109 [Artomyces pyxidatus]|uniref:Uncharacterized protein n=1 Tax=Artomyces pyxidatus TaxID=48021 RepID=A0ACB8SFS1_9AGAM|nr:hypothetical protein BV25DRAFT_1843109 [Artomyces pyxidatus]
MKHGQDCRAAYDTVTTVALEQEGHRDDVRHAVYGTSRVDDLLAQGLKGGPTALLWKRVAGRLYVWLDANEKLEYREGHELPRGDDVAPAAEARAGDGTFHVCGYVYNGRATIEGDTGFQEHAIQLSRATITAQQAQAESLCLCFPETLSLHTTLTYEVAVTMLTRAIQLSGRVPYRWAYINKPPDGQVCLLFIPAQFSFPPDGIRFWATASRVRRRYRLSKGGHAQLVLVHYSRGCAVPIPPALHVQPVRAYPLRPIIETAMFVTGDETRQKVPIGLPNAAARLAAQSRDMEALERGWQAPPLRFLSQRPGLSLENGRGNRPPGNVQEQDSRDRNVISRLVVPGDGESVLAQDSSPKINIAADDRLGEGTSSAATEQPLSAPRAPPKNDEAATTTQKVLHHHFPSRSR